MSVRSRRAKVLHVTAVRVTVTVMVTVIASLIGAGLPDRATAQDEPQIWLAGPDLLLGRFAPAVASAPDGRVYVIGGYTQTGVTTEAEVLVDGSWRQIASLPAPRYYSSAAAGRDGRIYVFGGFDGSEPVSTTYVYEPSTDSWSQTTPDPAGARYATATTATPDGRIVVIGGNPQRDYLLDNVQVFEPGTATWTAARPTLQPIQLAGAVTGPDGRVYLFGGTTDLHVNGSTTAQVYDPVDDSWSLLRSLPPQLSSSHPGVAAVGDGRIVIAGGYVGDAGPTGDAVVYHIATDTYTPLNPIQARYALGAASGPDGTVYMISGATGTRCCNATVERMRFALLDTSPPTLSTPTWTNNPMPVHTPTQPATATVQVLAHDVGTGVRGGEWIIGPDPGVGNAAPMTYVNGTLSATFGPGLPVGVHDVAVRAQDGAGNWSAVTRTMLVIYDPAGPGVTGKNKKDLVPSLAAGDILPGLVGPDQSDAVDYGFTIAYRADALDGRNDVHLVYATGTRCGTASATNCHRLTLDATSIHWMVIDQANSARSRAQGTASVTVDGVTSTNTFTVEAVDGGRLTPVEPDRVVFKIYPAGAGVSGAPLYQASGTVDKDHAVVIR